MCDNNNLRGIRINYYEQFNHKIIIKCNNNPLLYLPRNISFISSLNMTMSNNNNYYKELDKIEERRNEIRLKILKRRIIKNNYDAIYIFLLMNDLHKYL